MREFKVTSQANNHRSLAILSGIKKYQNFHDCKIATIGFDDLENSLLNSGFDVLSVTDGNVSRPSFIIDSLATLDHTKYNQIFIYFSCWFAHTKERNITLLFTSNSAPWKVKTFISLRDFILRIATSVPTCLILNLYGFPNEAIETWELEKIEPPKNLGIILNKNMGESITEKSHAWVVNWFLEILMQGPKVIQNYTGQQLAASLQALAEIRTKKNYVEINGSAVLERFSFWNRNVENTNSLLFHTGDDINSEVLGEREDAIQELRHFLTNTNSKHISFLAQEYLLQRLYIEKDQRVVTLIKDILLSQRFKRVYDNVLSTMEIKSEDNNVPDIPFVKIPEGNFIMGTDDSLYPPENPSHVVFLPPYAISKYPITWRNFLCFINDTNYPFDYKNYFMSNDHLDHPVNNVSWYDSMAFCSWLTNIFIVKNVIRENEQIILPTESEWEKASRGTDGKKYPWGNYYKPGLCNDVNANVGYTTKVGNYSPDGDSVYGCVDIVGNIHEWTLSLWGKGYRSPRYRYPYAMSDGREDWDASSSIRRIVRGGAFYYDPSCVRCSTRNYKYPALRQIGSGFRVVLKTTIK